MTKQEQSLLDKWIPRLNKDEWIMPARQILIEMGDVGLDAVFEAFNHPQSRQMHENASEILFCAGSAGADRLMTRVNKNDVPFPMSYASFLGQLKDRRAVPFLIELLKSKSQYDRWAAVDALHQIGDSSAVPPIIGRLKDRAGLVRFSAIKAVGDLADENAIISLQQTKTKEAGEKIAVENAIAAIKQRAGVNAES